MTRLVGGITAIGLLLLAGCGSGEPFSHVPVSGKVTYEDGSIIPAERITVVFAPQAPPLDPKTNPRPGYAEVNVANGTFAAATTSPTIPDDGIVVGKHKVAVKSFIGDTPSPHVPEKFKDPSTSGIVVDTADKPFHIKVPKP